MLKMKYLTPSGVFLMLDGASSVLNPRDNTVLFVGRKMLDKLSNLESLSGCLIFVEKEAEISETVVSRNEVIFSDNPRRDFGAFLEESNAERSTSWSFIHSNGSIVAREAEIGKSVVLYPGCYIESDVKIGEGTIIHSGSRILAGSRIGRNCVIHDNVVIGSLSMAYEGPQRIPQIGGVSIGDDVHIGAQSVVCRGAIEDTVIADGVRIDNCCSIAHNNHIGCNAIIICGTKLFGSVTVGENAYISGGATVKNGLNIGENALVGLGSVVIHDVEPGQVVVGNPARFLRNR